MGKVDHADDTVDHRVAQSQQGIHAAQLQAIDQILQDRSH